MTDILSFLLGVAFGCLLIFLRGFFGAWWRSRND
jgi:hypothetical protein